MVDTTPTTNEVTEVGRHDSASATSSVAEVSAAQAATKSKSAKTTSRTRKTTRSTSATTAPEPGVFGRIAVLNVAPYAENGMFPARVALGEPFTVSAQVVADGDAIIGATAVLSTARGKILQSVPMTCTDADTATFTAMLQAGEPSACKPWDDEFATLKRQLGAHTLTIEGWSDPYATWLRETEKPADIVSNTVLDAGVELLTRWSKTKETKLNAAQKKELTAAAKQLADTTLSFEERLAAATADAIQQLHLSNPLRDDVATSHPCPLRVERSESSFSSWYAFFPKSEGATSNGDGTITPGTLSSSTSGLQRAKAEGFTIVHLPAFIPTNPTSEASNLADPDNESESAALQTFCTKAHDLGLEVALDITPGAKDTDKDTTRQLLAWADAGVTVFRAANAACKPLGFWQSVIAAVTKKHAGVLFLAEDHTHPAAMRALGYAGFTQSDCQFPWRNTKQELDAYLAQTNGETGFYEHRSFWPASHVIMTDYLRDNGVTGFAIRAVLAAMGSASWGITAGYELVENLQREGTEAPVIDETEQAVARDWSKAEDKGIAELVTSLNRIRAEHPSLHSYHTLTVLPTNNAFITAFVRHTPAEFTGTGKPDTLIVVVNLDTNNDQPANIHLDLDQLGLPTDHPFQVKDELTGHEFEWSWDNYVSLAPWADVAHILSVQY
ncbi:maltotransferase domain-containing protein [Bifidobacterium gallicum]|uniref:Alpha-amylase family protein n=1 Tax=Bifidobacterium gallicum DSM 20093 = LMG 11596 TaxID=561180 RepID=D1NWR3_9BIFI|nr:maltotransferase domain-containing protein [Bifidobacterium gallicum]EFA22222.1 hypothetical protein BIFGAL_04319 [Bifidobacterium gallicum DSM 20093 = LMG 11596]KFI59045.1 alpha-amylase family protein [Bifidobacterium gallicum DSM 20093 = LMG 11596]